MGCHSAGDTIQRTILVPAFSCMEAEHKCGQVTDQTFHEHHRKTRKSSFAVFMCFSSCVEISLLGFFLFIWFKFSFLGI